MRMLTSLCCILTLFAESACSAPRTAKPPARPTAQYSVDGVKRTIVGTGNDLDKLHAYVQQHFIRDVELEIKDPRNAYIIGNLGTGVGKKDGRYKIRYTITLTPTNRPDY